MSSAEAHRRRLDPRERTHLIDGPREGSRLFLRALAPAAGEPRGAVLYLHGATFPSALSVAYRFADGRSWRDALCDGGLDVWALDFSGFGGSDRYPEMDEDPEAHGPLGLAAEAARQVETAVRFILAETGAARLSLITHSWGSMPAGLFAAAHPTWVDRIVMFAPLARREGPRYTPRPDAPAWKVVTNAGQWDRFVEDVPAHEPPVLSRGEFARWAEAYLDSDPGARERDPPGVKTPTGPLVEILRAWHGELAWTPEEVQAPVCIVRGDWDGLAADDDARWLFGRLTRARERRDVKIARGTHLMHLEEMRGALWRESLAFLSGDHPAPSPPTLCTQSHEGETPMEDHHEDKDLPGYNPGAPEVARSPISMEEFNELKATVLLGHEDIVYLRLSLEVLKDQAEDLVDAWRGVSALIPHLRACFVDPHTGEQDKQYGERVGARFVQWVFDTARAEYDETWLDYQYEIGLRHHRMKKNQTDSAKGSKHIRGRDVIGFSAGIVSTMKPYLEKGGHSPETVNRMHMAWMKSMILQATLWSQPYMNPGDF